MEQWIPQSADIEVKRMEEEFVSILCHGVMLQEKK